jgi:ubiquinone/menaquinone biosynthesis C-methylase UbiE
MNYDQTSIPEAYNKGRDHGPAFLQQWMQVVAGHINPSQVGDILDLGCGTGRFADGLAGRFNATLIGLDPSTKMLQQALAGRRNTRIYYANGQAEALPLLPESIDLVFISMAFHHFSDPNAVAKECCRVLRPHGRLCLRTASLEKISMYPYVPFFPASVALLQQRLPSLEFQRTVFEAASFRTLSYDVITQEIAADLVAYADKIATKADSILASLKESDFQAGMRALRAEAARAPRRAVTEPIDFLVFGKNDL